MGTIIGSEVQSGDQAFDLSQKWRQEVTRRKSDSSKFSMKAEKSEGVTGFPSYKRQLLK